MLSSRRAATTGTPPTTTLPKAPGRRGRPRSAPPPGPGRAGPGRPGRPRNDTARNVGRGGSGRATAARTHRTGGGRDSAWSRSRTPTGADHQVIEVGRAAGGMARSCRTVHPCRASGSRRRAVRRSPPPGDGVGAGPEPQPAVTAASTPRIRLTRVASRLPYTPAAAPTPRRTATRQGSVRVQAAHLTARCWRHLAWAEPPGRPTVARTRTATTDRSALVPASSWSGSSPRWGRG
jgi:hypothetical protein